MVAESVVVQAIFHRLIKAMCADSKIAKPMTCAATKCTQISKVIGKEYQNEVLEALQQQAFSLLIDESHSRRDPVLAVLARFYDRYKGYSTTKFVTLLS